MYHQFLIYRHLAVSNGLLLQRSSSWLHIDMSLFMWNDIWIHLMTNWKILIAIHFILVQVLPIKRPWWNQNWAFLEIKWWSRLVELLTSPAGNKIKALQTFLFKRPMVGSSDILGLFFFNRQLFYFLDLKILFVFLLRERVREGEREREKHQLVASHMPQTGDGAHNPGMCPDYKSNQWTFDLLANTQSTEPHQSGHRNIWGFITLQIF